MDDEDKPSQQGSRRRARRKSNRHSIFCTNRSSFETEHVIRERENLKAFEERLSLRRQSRAYSSAIDESDILHPQTRIRFEWKDIEYSVISKNFIGKVISQKQILSAVSGSAHPGNIVAILGSSGAGKSTLLNILAGKANHGKIKGKILMNGIERERIHLRVIAFVEQGTPYLDSFLTVREVLEMTANLTLPAKYTASEKGKKIEKVMKTTKIEGIADTIVGGEGESGISGGERKRLAIAKELLGDPKVIFLDEPTSGLDAATSAGLVKFLRELAIIDHLTVIMTVHQPRISVLSKFDFFILLADGKTVFNGNVDEALEHFKQQGFEFMKGQNPADFFLDTLSITNDEGQNPLTKFQEAWEPFENAISNNIIVNNAVLSKEKLTKFEQPINRLKEIQILFQWKLKSIFRDKSNCYGLIIDYFYCFFVVMSVFFQIPINGFAAVQNRIGFITYISYDSAALMNFCIFLVSERNRIIDERRSYKYRLSSFFIATALVEILLWSIFPLPFWIALYYIVHLRYVPFTSFLIFLAMQIGYLIVAVFIGGIAGAIFNDLGTSIRIVNMIWFVFKIFGGTSLNTDNVSPVLAWFRYISAPYFLQAGLTQNEFLGQTINEEPGIYWVESFGFNGASEMWCAGAIMIMMAGFYLISFTILYIRTTPRFKI